MRARRRVLHGVAGHRPFYLRIKYYMLQVCSTATARLTGVNTCQQNAGIVVYDPREERTVHVRPRPTLRSVSCPVVGSKIVGFGSSFTVFAPYTLKRVILNKKLNWESAKSQKKEENKTKHDFRTLPNTDNGVNSYGDKAIRHLAQFI